MRLALIGYGNVGRAFAHLIHSQRSAFPFRIVAIHTAHHGTAYNPQGVDIDPRMGHPARSIDEFLERSQAEVALEITTLNPATGEPAISHIRSAFAHRVHVITANKGPIAHAYAQLREEAERAMVQFRFESTVMDGAPVFNMFRNNMPGVKVLGFSGALNSTSKLVIAAMRRGLSFEDGIRQAQELGVAEADASYDTDGWDSAAKGAALANVLMDARMTPLDVDRKGMGKLTTDRLQALAAKRKTVGLITRGRMTPSGVKVRVRAEILDDNDVLATVQGTSNIVLFHTDLMGILGTVSISPRVEQTAYGLFSDLVDIARVI